MSDRPLPASPVPPDLAWSDLQTWDPRESANDRPMLLGVAIAIHDATLRQAVTDALGRGDALLVGEEMQAMAAIVVSDAPNGVAQAMADMRARTRPEAAIVIVLGPNDSSDDFDAAYDAGAASCIKHPLAARELLAVVGSIVESQTAKERVDDLVRKLDMQTHLASVGRATAGLGHELSNPLTVLTASFDTVREAMLGLLVGRAAEPEALASLDEMDRALARIREILRTVRDLSRDGTTARMQPIDVGAVARRVREWTAADLEGVEVEERIDDTVLALGDPTLLAQIVVNFVTNAAAAAKQLSSPRVRLHVYATDTMAIVSVRDNGPGIPESARERIFEPFFTTRRGQGGTGLGLALCREYALRMDARITLWTARGRGTCFRLHMRRPPG